MTKVMELLIGRGVDLRAAQKFPPALRLYDRAFNINPDDPDVIAGKAIIYQAEGNLQEAARCLPQISETSSSIAGAYIGQLQYERNFDQLIRFCEARLAQGHFASDLDKAFAQVVLACNQRLAGDTAGAKLTAEKARNTLELAYRRKEGHGWRSRNSHLEESLSRTYAMMEKELGPKHRTARSHALAPR